MSTSKFIGRVGALAVALGVGFAATVTPGVALAESANPPPPDRIALILGGTTIPTPDDHMVELSMNQYIRPTHHGQDIETVKVTAPQELWPLTGFARILGLLGPPDIFGLGGPAFPDEPLWKLSGLFDRSAGQSLQVGAANLETAVENTMAANPGVPLTIFGVSQGAGVANIVKRRLAEQYPDGTVAPDIDFVLLADINLPNGGIMSRFAGLYIPILDFPFNGPALTDTQFDTVELYRQYDGFTDFPLYPLNFISTFNAVLGIVYVHTYAFEVSLPAEPADPTTSPAFQGTHGDTSYYFFANPDLPLFGPLRTLGVPEPLIDVFEPFFRVIVETGYDRSIDPWEPTPARLIPRINPATLAADLVGAIGEGINNALAITGAPAPLSLPKAPAFRTENGDMLDKSMSVETVTETVQVKPLEQKTEIDQVELPKQKTDNEPTDLKNFSIPKPDKKADRPPTHRPVRDALKALGQKIRGVLKSRDADAPNVVAPASKDGPAPADPPSGDDGKDVAGS